MVFFVAVPVVALGAISPLLRRLRGRKPNFFRTMLTWGLLTMMPCFLSVSMITTGLGFSPFAFIAPATRLISADLLTSPFAFLPTSFMAGFLVSVFGAGFEASRVIGGSEGECL